MKSPYGVILMKINNEQIVYLEENIGKNIIPLSTYENMNFVGSKPTEILLFYKKEISLSEIKETFFKAIGFYNLFSSRLIMIDQNKFALQYCMDGVEYNVLPSVNDTFDHVNIDDIKKMIVHVKTLPGEPLLALTVIPIKDGKFGGISYSHAISDGISVMLFLFTWACIIEGKNFPLPSPQRLFQGHPVWSDTIDKVFTPSLSELSDKVKNQVKSSNIKTYSKKEYFSDEFLNEIKNQAKRENMQKDISNNQIMISFLLKKYHNQILPNTDRVVIRNPVNLRDIHPDIDALYIGNANLNSFTEFTKDEINKMSISQIAYRLKESITNMRDEKFIRELAALSKCGIEINMDMYFKNRTFFNIESDIVSTNLTHWSDLESIGIGSNIGSVLSVGFTAPTSFVILKEKSGRIFAQITSRYPFT